MFRIIYCSRNRLGGTAAQVDEAISKILKSAQTNNAALDVTGALLYNEGNFAQVLEGPLGSVCEIFEKIQRDLRHSEVTIVETGMIAERQFADWAMAFSGGGFGSPSRRASDLFEAAFAGTLQKGEDIQSLLRDLLAESEESVALQPM
jgi:hypothetical protein